MRDEMMRQEIMEAIETGERALYSLRAAREQLSEARTWGIIDIFGGGFLTDLVKHSKMNQAASCIETAKDDLRRFQKELKDVMVLDNIQLKTGDFLLFADFFFDGFVADYLMQSRIAAARQQVEGAIVRVEDLLHELRQMKYI